MWIVAYYIALFIFSLMSLLYFFPERIFFSCIFIYMYNHVHFV